MIELAITALVLGLTLMSALIAIRVQSRGVLVSRDNLRANTLAMGKLDELKNAALIASYGGSWAYVTQSALARSYGTTNVSVLGTKSFTWTVNSRFMYQNGTTLAETASNTITTSMVRYQIRVSWQDVFMNKTITQTAYVSDMRQ